MCSHERLVFGCGDCRGRGQRLDCWTCGCGDDRLPSCSYCMVCRRRRPLRFSERALHLVGDQVETPLLPGVIWWG